MGELERHESISVDHRRSNINVPRKYQFNSLQTHIRLKMKNDCFKAVRIV